MVSEMTRRRAVLLLSASAALAGPASAQPVSAADARFEALQRRWLEGALRLSPSFATGVGEHRYDHNIDDLSPAGRARALAFAQSMLRALEAMDATKLTRANQVDAALLANELRSEIWTEQVMQSWAWDPLYYHNSVGNSLYTLMARDFAPLPVRLEAATARMKALPAIFAHARAQLAPARTPEIYATTAIAQNRGLKSIIDDLIAPHKEALSVSKRTELESAITLFKSAVDAHQHWLETSLQPGAHGEFRLGAEKFDQKLELTLQTTLTRQEIRQRAEAALVATRAEMYRISTGVLAGRRGAPPTPASPTPEQEHAAIRAALDLAAAERAPRAQLVEVATHAVEEATAFVRTRDLITLPDAPVRVILMPEFQRGFSVAYCDSPGPLEHGLETFYAVSPIPDDWTDEQTTSFLREYNTRAIGDIGVHEAMPGHYVQIWHSNQYPSTLRAVLGSGSFIEGWAVYAEDTMAREGFHGDDPLYRLSQLKVMLRTITNALLDQAIHVDGVSRDDAMKLMVDGAFQEEREAAGKWVRAQLSSTQLSTYFVGFSEHAACRAEAERRWGGAFKLKDYHDRVLAFGSPPMRYARALLLDDPIV